VIDSWSCTPWDPPEPYTCGTFALHAEAGETVMLKATNNWGHKDTLTGIFEVEPGQGHIIVMVQEDIVDLVSDVWGITADPEKGHVAGIVSTSSGDIYASPFDEYIGDATVEITPSDGFGGDFALVYYDSTDMFNTGLGATDAAAPFFVALNVPPAPFDTPYTITVEHDTYTFTPMQFITEADVLTYLIMSPE